MRSSQAGRQQSNTSHKESLDQVKEVVLFKSQVHNDVHNDTLDKIFVRLFVDDETEAQVALGRLRNEFARLGVAPSTTKLIYGDDLLHKLYERSKEYEERAEKAERENILLRKHASKAGRRALSVERSGQADGWDRLVDALQLKIPMSRGWKTLAAKALDLKPSEFRDYEQRLRAVPEAVIVRASQLQQPISAKQPKATKRKAASIPPGTKVLDTGPMSFEELRLIGSFFDAQDCIGGACRIVNATRKTISDWKRRGIPRNQVKAIRLRYWEARNTPRESKLLETVVEEAAILS